MTLYLDTSSLVKLYVAEPGSDEVRAQVDRSSIVATSLLAYPETRAALARRRRERALRATSFTLAKRTFEEDWPRYFVVHLGDVMCREAGRLAERYALRGYDSVHLACYLEILRQTGPKGTIFSSFDDRLNRAARLAARAIR